MTGFPTTKDIVRTALADDNPRDVIVCEDLDGNSNTLRLVPLGGKVAIICPMGEVVVIDEEQVTEFGVMEQLSVTGVRGGRISFGAAPIQVRSGSGPKETARLYIDVRSHGTEARIDISTIAARPPFPMFLYATAETAHQLADMFQDVCRVLKGEAPTGSVEKVDGQDAEVTRYTS